MTLRRLLFVLVAAGLIGSLALPTRAEQTFKSISTGSLPAPGATLNPYEYLNVDYLYYPCNRNWRPNGYDTRNTYCGGQHGWPNLRPRPYPYTHSRPARPSRPHPVIRHT